MSDEPDKPFTFARQGILFILSAPSGAGKTTLSAPTVTTGAESHVLRFPTPLGSLAPVKSTDVTIISSAKLNSCRLQKQNAFAEWAHVHDFFYGTARAPLEEALTREATFSSILMSKE